MAQFMAKHSSFLGIRGEVGWVSALLIWPWMWHQMWCVRYTATVKCWPSRYCDSLNSINRVVTMCTTFFYIRELCTFHSRMLLHVQGSLCLSFPGQNSVSITCVSVAEKACFRQLTCFYNRDGVCLLRGTDWVFIYNSTFCPHSVFMYFVWISEQTAIIPYTALITVFITETGCVYCAVRTWSLGIILRSAHTVYLCVLCGSENKRRLFPCTVLIGWLL